MPLNRLGKYDILQIIGNGGFGRVYKAHDSVLDRFTALKVLHPKLTVNHQFVNNFMAEARHLAKIEHPNVVRIYEVNEVEGRLFIAMQFLSGGNLAERIAKTPLPLEAALTAIIQIADGLGAGHQQGIIHHDVKPGNILFDESDAAVVADFGIAEAVQSSTLSVTTSQTTGLGTPLYRPPEFWRGAGSSGPSSDIYSLACVFYEMLTGKILFQAETLDAILVRHMREDPLPTICRSLPNMPKRLQGVFARALAKRPEDRFQSTAAFTKALVPTFPKVASKSMPIIKAAGVKTGQEEQIQPTPTGASLQNREQSWKKILGMAVLWLSGLVSFLALIALMVWVARGILFEPPQPTHSDNTPVIQLTSDGTVFDDPNQTVPAPSDPVTVTAPAPTDTVDVEVEVMLTSTVELPAAGSELTNTVDNAVMVFIPAGSFLMGNEGERAYEDEGPVHTVTLDAYWIYKYEVTQDQYLLCLQIGPCEGKFEHYLGDDLPAVNIDWYAAQTYCEWADGRLPTEAEWEKAARGQDARLYPWGDDPPSCSRANYMGCQGSTLPVGSLPSGGSPYGVMDLAGNVWEWVADWYGPDYYTHSPTNNPQGAVFADDRVQRGGSWNDDPDIMRITNRYHNPPDVSSNNDGFRCVVPYAP